ncbi:hypothetical protein TNCV_5118171 [Trichonephila clavipes]|nr:hypothetical protein TNCV_5118171 [Trichonephila clavipes]
MRSMYWNSKFRSAVGSEFLLMDGNTLLCQAYEELKYLKIEDITRKNWPSYSPDLNLIEHEPNSFPDSPGVEKRTFTKEAHNFT